MSQGPETTFIKSVHKHLPDSVYRMKNHNVYNGGVADCWYSGAGGDIWIEYKFISVPSKPKTTIDLSKHLSALQMQWLTDRYVEGRNIAVIVGCKDGGVWFERRLWESPLTAEAFRSAIESRKEIAERICEHTYG